ncbi:hypothetical protein GDO81_002023 [Engystomops pustulosus]|uniref:Uncharacterized protein n=1 Tax=Engystomops pustulosus TaxID=76066 RepID=A0AAV7DGU7_ENGPU|nr:hypothetical protein GDO81_002023 [Engystomops pustulosus]
MMDAILLSLLVPGLLSIVATCYLLDAVSWVLRLAGMLCVWMLCKDYQSNSRLAKTKQKVTNLSNYNALLF